VLAVSRCTAITTKSTK